MAGVAPAIRPGHPLHHEALVADDDSAAHVVVESLALQHESVRGQCRMSIQVFICKINLLIDKSHGKISCGLGILTEALYNH